MNFGAISRGGRAAACLALLLAVPAALAAQPFWPWSVFAGNGTLGASNGRLEIPHDPALNPASAITLEAWVSVNLPSAGQTCRSIVGKNYISSYWVGYCGSGPTATLRSYVRGTASLRDGGVIPNGKLIHIAITSDGATRNHYIDGELVASFPETGPPTASTAPLDIGGDASWQYSPNGLVNEVRLWSVARTVDQIRATINVPLRSAQPGLVAVWSLGGPNDALGGHNGTFVGNLPPVLPPPAIFSCGPSTSSALCLQGHFFLTATWRTGPPGTGTTGNASVVVAGPDSGVMWFFASSNWELMVKVINGCGLNHAWWLFSAALTNVYYELDVTDVQSGVTKIYFNYPGPPAPAVTDTSAFGPC
jgi:hypothetical protein